MNAARDMSTSTTPETRASELRVRPWALATAIALSCFLAALGLAAVILGLWAVVSDLMVSGELLDGLGILLGSILAATGAATIAAFGLPALVLHRRRAAGSAPRALRVPLRVVATLALLIAAVIAIPLLLQLGLTILLGGRGSDPPLAVTASLLLLAAPPAALGVASSLALTRR